MADNTLCNNLNTIPIITTAITTTQICIGDLLINTKGPDHNLSNKEDAQDPQLVPLLVSRYFFQRSLWNTQLQMYSLQNQNWYGNWFYPTPKPEETEEDSTTKPNYNQNQFVISYLQGVPTSFGSNNPFFTGWMSIFWLRLQRRILRLLLWITSNAELWKQSLWSNQWLAPKLLWFKQPRVELRSLLRQQSVHCRLPKLRTRWRILRYRKMFLFQKNFQKQQCCWQWQFSCFFFSIKKKVNKEHSSTYLIRITRLINFRKLDFGVKSDVGNGSNVGRGARGGKEGFGKVNSQTKAKLHNVWKLLKMSNFNFGIFHQYLSY